jgi:hypothetical protein
MKYKSTLFFCAGLMLASLACGLFGGSGSSGVSDSSSPTGQSGNSGKYDTEFPLPANVQHFTTLDDGSINYQTSMKLTEVVDFYREAFKQAGYKERDITTVINDATFSIVWDGHPSGKAVVVQGVDLGDGTVNVNVRLEDV